ncbi:hypothetical protein BLS_009081 [Venturia inaequalis]|uniref:Uncharacterized protein n=1 Tax=Venturia inaequalis TaxID=5025 RepID=A0A8H3YKD2_VENIN|nr:hypothetical protein BLS_009081 [Venturia inaequalis]
MFNETLSRHNYSSSCPPGNPKYSIAKKLSKCIRSTKKSQLAPKWQLVFNELTRPAYERIRIPLDQPDGQTGATGINGTSHRMCSTGSTFPPLLLVGIPKHDPCVPIDESTLARLNTNRRKFVKRTHKKWKDTWQMEHAASVKDKPDEQWADYPDLKNCPEPDPNERSSK